MRTRNKPTVLLIAEAVTLAHFARIVTLAEALDPAVYDVVIASDPRYLDLGSPVGCTFYSIQSISPEDFAQALALGKPLFCEETLTGYVEDDLALLDNVKPSLVIGDFRLSLAVSAPLRKIPYAALVNAYWSPFASVTYPVPDLPITRFLGVRAAQSLFDIVRPVAFALHAKPLNQVRKRFGLPPIGGDMRNTYTFADYTLYADIPEVVPTYNLPAHHRYLGPVLWSVQTPLPVWWEQLTREKPLVFVTLGSSGQAELLPTVLAALSNLAITVIAATAKKIILADKPANAYITDYLPVNIATQCARLVISNGGSLTTYQSLSSGVPVIGLCSNMDQLLNMSAVQRLGAGITLRAATVSPADLLESANAILNNPSYTQAANKVSLILAQSDANQHFREFVAEILDSSSLKYLSNP